MGNLSDFAKNYNQISTERPQQVTFQEVANMARGQWGNLLPALGVDAHSLTGKHCACPGCGGKDRFRYDNKDGDGTFVCSQGNGQLMAGDGFMLLEHVHGWSRGESFQAVKQALGMSQNASYTPPPIKATAQTQPANTYKPNYRKELSRVKEIWGQSQPLKGTLVQTYLESRGIQTEFIPTDANIRFHRWLTRYKSDGNGGFQVLHEGPAMVALITNIHDEILGVHETYLKTDGTGKAVIPGTDNVKFLRKCVPQMNGGAVRIHVPDPKTGMIGIGEGIESALSMNTLIGRQGNMMPVMAALNTSLLADWVPPESAKQIAILADNDTAGLSAAEKLKTRLQQFRPDAAVDIIVPPGQGYDWNDALLHKTHKNSASPK